MYSLTHNTHTHTHTDTDTHTHTHTHTQLTETFSEAINIAIQPCHIEQYYYTAVSTITTSGLILHSCMVAFTEYMCVGYITIAS